MRAGLVESAVLCVVVLSRSLAATSDARQTAACKACRCCNATREQDVLGRRLQVDSWTREARQIEDGVYATQT